MKFKLWPKGIGPKRFALDLYREMNDDNVFNGAAALAFYLLFAAFPAMVFLLSLLPYLPIDNLHQAVMDFVRQAMPGQAANQVEQVIGEVTLNKREGLLSFGAIATLWFASSGIYAIMQQLNFTYDVKDSRPFWKLRLIAMGLTLASAVLVAGAFALIVFGGIMQSWLGDQLGMSSALLATFWVFRWAVIGFMLLMGFALMYYFGPDVEQEFKFITAGSLMGVIILAAAALGFRYYVENFGNYSATYGSLGAVIIFILWLYISGLVLLIGSEINAVIEHYSPEGKVLGEKQQPEFNDNRGAPLERLDSTSVKPGSAKAKSQKGRGASGGVPSYAQRSAGSSRQWDFENDRRQQGGTGVDVLLALLAWGYALTRKRKNV